MVAYGRLTVYKIFSKVRLRKTEFWLRVFWSFFLGWKCWIDFHNTAFMHTMSADMKKIPLGPPPSYDTPPLDLGDGKKQSNVGLFSLLMEDPPPYKENNSPTESFSSFQFLPPLALRPWKRFFSMCLSGRCSSSAENFGHNLVYYQVNYAWLMLLLVMVALLV